jgi:hypothetical protein
MITRREGQPWSGDRQTQVTQVLMIEAGAWLLDVAAVMLLDEIKVVPHDVGPSRAPAADHEGDRQREGFETDGQVGGHEYDS